MGVSSGSISAAHRLTRRRSLVAALAFALTAALLLGLVLVPLVLAGFASGPRWLPLLLVAVGWVNLAAGALAWLRRPSNGIGALLLACGIVWQTTALLFITVAPLRTAGAALALAPVASGERATGYLLKQRITDLDRFFADLRRILAGGSVLNAEVVAALLRRPRRDDALAQLTSRQLEVLELMAQGCSNAAIAAQLTIAEKSVVRHVSHIYAELGLEPSATAHRRVLAVVAYLAS
ncbi:LuxR C-terminal-related transcriptional regulator [Conexibacter sp. CPCC 206217]|uniref:LuxR C-terminal-related transcriptional regulator n=1 Tax=Conexibacter sp. CPCC 206217 TaxID=3064574 RepID=UPI002723D096|nr:LuxR C-terminal-related transcriptional regulator [Conexibacter sp. CPCC 206217]MDO8213545.1 LuxR C-terminal-related transcriptional regulator [Conexibacter sp. CPCC 206217]